MGNEELHEVKQGQRGSVAGGAQRSPLHVEAGQYVPPWAGVSLSSSARPKNPQPADTVR